MFSVESLYRTFKYGGKCCHLATRLWKVCCPLKVRLFLWPLTKGAFLTWLKLQRRWWIGPSICMLCMEEGESTTHIMLSCCFMKFIWQSAAETLGIRINMTSNQNTWLRAGKWDAAWSIRYTMMSAICWHIWRERNNRLFKNSTSTPLDCLFRIYIDIVFWTGLSMDGESIIRLPVGPPILSPFREDTQTEPTRGEPKADWSTQRQRGGWVISSVA